MKKVAYVVGCLAIMSSVAGAEERPESIGESRVPPVPGVGIPRDHVSKILFLNRCENGCTLYPGRNDARQNTSTIVEGTSQISAFVHGDDVWNQVVDCVKELYAPYDVLVTDVDPGESALHHEAIVAGDWNEIGYDYPVGGVAPSQCMPANNVISFTFANGYGPNAIQICAVVGQETAHSYGLEHAFNCADPMTYLQACGRQFFRDVAAPCGEYEARELCQCGGSAQNSHRWLKSVLGENPVPVPGPELEVTSPTDGAEVTNGFTVELTATHVRGIGHIDLVINGTEYASVDGHPDGRQSLPYELKAPDDLADGIMDIEIRAYNDIESETVASFTVTKGEPCTSAEQCNSGQQCEDGRCFFPPPTGELGDSCELDAECISGVCPSDGDEAFCSEWCFPSEITDSCPGGYECVEVGTNQGVCWRVDGDGGGGGGGCSTGAGGRGALLLLGLLAFGLTRRRRQPGLS